MSLKELKKEHYENTELVVKDIARREITFGLKIRHQAFSDVEDLRSVLAARPKIDGCFASTAYYLDPHVRAPTKKGHLGTDLVFDIDVNPTTNRLNWLYDICYRTSAVLDILTNELGFSKEDMMLDFSGNKGFHITVTDASYNDMSKTDRTQLGKYILGEGVVRKNLEYGKGGWNRRYAFYLQNLAKLTGDDAKKNRKVLDGLGLPKITAKKLSDLLTDSTKREALSKGRLSFLGDKIVTALQSNFFNQQKELLSCVDKSVINDLYKIMRIPGTIHPKSGLVSTVLTIDDVDDPDAIFAKVKAAGGLDLVTITLDKEVTEDFDRVKVWPAGTHEVPRWLALHLLHQ